MGRAAGQLSPREFQARDDGGQGAVQKVRADGPRPERGPAQAAGGVHLPPGAAEGDQPHRARDPPDEGEGRPVRVARQRAFGPPVFAAGGERLQKRQGRQAPHLLLRRLVPLTVRGGGLRVGAVDVRAVRFNADDRDVLRRVADRSKNRRVGGYRSRRGRSVHVRQQEERVRVRGCG